jgi:hypothetical protein
MLFMMPSVTWKSFDMYRRILASLKPTQLHGESYVLAYQQQRVAYR